MADFASAPAFLNKTHYFVENNGQPRGISFDALAEFERFVDWRLSPGNKTGKNKVLVALTSENPARIEQDLQSWKADFVALPICITQDRKKRVDFIQVGARREPVVISGLAAPAL